MRFRARSIFLSVRNASRNCLLGLLPRQTQANINATSFRQQGVSFAKVWICDCYIKLRSRPCPSQLFPQILSLLPSASVSICNIAFLRLTSTNYLCISTLSPDPTTMNLILRLFDGIASHTVPMKVDKVAEADCRDSARLAGYWSLHGSIFATIVLVISALLLVNILNSSSFHRQIGRIVRNPMIHSVALATGMVWRGKLVSLVDVRVLTSS